MSFSDALAYPFRGRNKQLFFVLCVVYFIVNSAINLIPGNTSALSIPVSIMMTAYYYAVLRDLALGYTDMPAIRRAFEFYRQGAAVTIMQLVFLLIPGVLLFFLYFNNPTQAIIIGLILSIPFYCFIAIATLRYVAEDEWQAMYDIPTNLALFSSRFGATLRFLLSSVGIWFISVGLIVLLSIIFSSMFPGLVTGTAGYIVVYIFSFLMTILLLYGIIATTHLWYGYGVELGLFNDNSEKAKNDEYSFDA